MDWVSFSVKTKTNNDTQRKRERERERARARASKSELEREQERTSSLSHQNFGCASILLWFFYVFVWSNAILNKTRAVENILGSVFLFFKNLSILDIFPHMSADCLSWKKFPFIWLVALYGFKKEQKFSCHLQNCNGSIKNENFVSLWKYTAWPIKWKEISSGFTICSQKGSMSYSAQSIWVKIFKTGSFSKIAS